jgi:hypothetical protein
MGVAVRQGDEIAAVKVNGFLTFDFEPAFARQHDVELGVLFVGVDTNAPRRSGLHAPVASSAHPNRLQHVRKYVSSRHRTTKQKNNRNMR